MLCSLESQQQVRPQEKMPPSTSLCGHCICQCTQEVQAKPLGAGRQHRPMTCLSAVFGDRLWLLWWCGWWWCRCFRSLGRPLSWSLSFDGRSPDWVVMLKSVPKPGAAWGQKRQMAVRKGRRGTCMWAVSKQGCGPCGHLPLGPGWPGGGVGESWSPGCEQQLAHLGPPGSCPGPFVFPHSVFTLLCLLPLSPPALSPYTASGPWALQGDPPVSTSV